MPRVRYFAAGSKDRRDVLHEMIDAIEKHADEIADLILARDWEPARSEDWEEVRKHCTALGELLHKARWSAMWELAELYKDQGIEEVSGNAD